MSGVSSLGPRLAALRDAGCAAELASALAAAVATAVVARGAFGAGFPVDDAWIHMVYGLGLLRDHAVTYNDGVPATGATSPLWVLVAALAHLVVGARGPSMAAATALKLASALAHAVSSALAARCGRLVASRRWLGTVSGLAAGLLVATCPVLVYAAASGMEVSATCALILLSFLLAARGRSAGVGVALGLAFWSRPECAVIAPVAVGLLALDARAVGTALRRAAVTLTVAGAFAAAVLVRNLLVSGHPFSATYYAKAAAPRGRIMMEMRLERGFAGVLGALAPTSSRLFWALVLLSVATAIAMSIPAFRRRVPFGSLRAARVGAALGLGGALYAGAASWMVRVMSVDLFYFQRYFAPAIPALIVAAVSATSSAVALLALLTRCARPRGRIRIARIGAVAAAAAAVFAQIAGLGAWAVRYRSDVADQDAVEPVVGRFLAATLPRDGVVWAMAAGATRYWSQRLVVDLVRLNTPELIEGGRVLPGYEADAIVVLGARMQVVGREGTLERVLGVRAPSMPLPPEGPEATEVVWRCRPGVAGPDAEVTILGLPEQRAGRCRTR